MKASLAPFTASRAKSSNGTSSATFLDSGMRSIWSLCVSADEAQDNHEIAKKLRRMKGAIEKMFAGPGWLKPAPADGKSEPQPPRDFLSNIRSERFRFVPDAAFAPGQALLTPEKLPALHNASFLTDGYGPSCALAQVAALLFRAFGASARDRRRERRLQPPTFSARAALP